MEKQLLLNKIKQAVQAIEPQSQIFLYGSRARNDAKADSDWDILVLVDGITNPTRTSQIRRQIYEIEWETEEVICTIVRSKNQWEHPLLQTTPFWQSVNKEAIML
ncbi:MAG: nucleotidyltransferase domain-containing protein [Microcystis aeruginosa W13-11]|nr:nucleotidyltransferase domain-containing protein [Microcystis aeruginosa W13-11]